MRKWYTYKLDSSVKGKIHIPQDKAYCDHAKAMGGYDADESYMTKSKFFNKYFFNYHLSRLEYYHCFLKKYLNKDEDILSIASGRCANELYLIQEGYEITCSDLEVLYAYKETKSLFPNFKFIKYDVLSGPAFQNYDAAICLGLIFLFDEKELSLFFYHVTQSLKSGGHLILDPGGSPDNFLSFVIHDVILKYETILRRIVRLVKDKKLYGLVIRDFGYRRTNKEIIEAAEKAGLELTAQENYAFLTEFKRSYLLNKLLSQSLVFERFFNIVGHGFPFIRMFNFKKITR